MTHYADLRTSFTPHPVTGDILLYDDASSVASEIKNLIFTNPYERFWDPLKGAGIPQTLFENISVDTEYKIETKIRDTINAYVTRARLVDVKVVASPDNNQYDCTIVFQMIHDNQPIKLNTVLRRVR